MLAALHAKRFANDQEAVHDETPSMISVELIAIDGTAGFRQTLQTVRKKAVLEEHPLPNAPNMALLFLPACQQRVRDKVYASSDAVLT